MAAQSKKGCLINSEWRKHRRSTRGDGLEGRRPTIESPSARTQRFRLLSRLNNGSARADIGKRIRALHRRHTVGPAADV